MTDVAEPGVGRRVDWIELFFDLALVAFVGELALGLDGNPGPAQFLTFVAWSVPAWWAWTNIMASINALPVLPLRLSGVSLLIATATIIVMASSVTETTDRAWAYALANGMLRLVLLVLWVYRAKRERRSPTSSIVYSGVTAVLWVASAFVPTPFNFIVWAIAILFEVLMLRTGTDSRVSNVHVDVAHASERLGLFMIILIGESVLSIVTSLTERWQAASAIAAALGFVAIALIAWGFFVSGGNVVEDGLRRLNDRGNVAGLLDTVMIIPYLIVASVTMFSAGLATGIADATEHLPLGAAICLGGGLALFYLTNAVTGLRYGLPLRRELPWALPAVLLPIAVVPLAPVLTGTTALLAITLSIVVVAVITAALARQRRVA